ncbi:MFS transporter [Chloroflexota bacterium]
MNAGNGYRWSILGLAWFCVFTFAILYQSIPPILGVLVDALRITHSQAGGLMSLFALPAVFLSIPGGLLADRYGTRVVGGASLLLMALGTLIAALGGSYLILGLGRLVTGTGAMVMVVVAPKIVTTWFREREIGLSMGVFNTSMPLGTIVSLSFMGKVGLQFGWKGPIWIGLAVSALALSLYLLLHRTKSSDGQVEAAPSGLVSSLREAGVGIWWVGLAWALFNAALISFFTYAPDYFITQGKEISQAGLQASYPMWGSLILAPVTGILIDKVGGKWLFVTIGCVGAAVLLYLMSWFTGQAALVSVLIGVSVAMVPPAIFSLPADLLPERLIGLGFGIIVTMFGVGVFLGPYAAGFLRDVTGTYLWSFTAMAVFAASGAVPMLLLKRQLGKTKGNSE